MYNFCPIPPPSDYNVNMMNSEELSGLKALAKNEIRRRQAELRILAHQIHSHPEIAMQEFQAAAWLSEALENDGFSVETGVSGLATAFRASYGGAPVIAFLAEYDALPGWGTPAATTSSRPAP